MNTWSFKTRLRISTSNLATICTADSLFLETFSLKMYNLAEEAFILQHCYNGLHRKCIP